MKVSNHILLDDHDQPGTFEPTDHRNGVISPIYIVMHYTAGTTARSAINWFQRPESKASSHLIIDRDGSITQMVALNRRAWHAGVSRWGELSDINTYSVGIELVNAGKLTKRLDGQWLSSSKSVVSAADVSIARHKNESTDAGWQEYTEQQLMALVAAGQAIASKYGIVDVLGHDDIAPTRKVDPGPLFPMSSIRSRILGRA